MPVRLALTVIVLAAATSASATAQVGYMPTASPYSDLTEQQTVTLYGGYFSGSAGSAGVGPRSGPLFGVRYALHLGGPADLVAHLARASSSRLLVNPNLPPASRNTASVSQGIYLADVGISVNLTGQKSYHHFVPVAGFGLGIASNGGQKVDANGYKFGNPFAISGTVGLRFVPGGNLSVRADLADYLFQLHYPNSFFLAPSGVTPILTPTSAVNEWTHNLVLTFGVSYVISR